MYQFYSFCVAAMNAQRMRWIKLLEYVYIMLKLYPNETNSIVMMACLQMVFIKF